MRKLSKSDRQFWKDYGIGPGVPSGNAMTMDQLGEAALRRIRDMSPDQKAILRARVLRSVGLIKPSEGKSS
jgi:hypothetical protein